ncbi:MAG TPA: histone deacetylase family protein [Gemmatimonadaceae bacterium]|jgi:Deacetylases, including yeast histone deacetylase and acetoin utilization protein
MIRFVHLYDADHEPRRMAEVQRIFRSYFGSAYGDYADQIPDLLRRQAELGHRTILITAEKAMGKMLAFALAFHYSDLNATLLDFIVVDPTVRQRGIGGALYEALREYLIRLGSSGLYFEVRPDAPELEPDATRRRENRARIRFYERYGARVITGTAYQNKRPGRAEGEPYIIFDSLGAPRVPKADEVRGMVSALLFRKYGYPRSDEYARSVVESVREGEMGLQEPRGRLAPAKPPTHHDVYSPLKVLVTPQHHLHHVRERGYVERPVRVERILQQVRSLAGVEIVDVKEHPEEAITAVHDPDFVRYLRDVSVKLAEGQAVYPYVFPIRHRARKPVDDEVQSGYYCIDTFTPLTHNAYIAARAAVDCALTGADLVRKGEQLAYAVCRPPGHHAESAVYGGFCYFNNASIAANVLSAEGKVAVLDIDFHHGNGTQEIFYDRSDVLTISIHGDPSYAYPYFAGFADERGEGAGDGFNHNYPLGENITDDEYLNTLEQALERVETFAPRFLVLSVGLDIAKGDPTGAWAITTDGFERIGGAIAGLGLPMLVVQEGGYDTRVIGRNARSFLSGLQRAIYERRLVRREAE